MSLRKYLGKTIHYIFQDPSGNVLVDRVMTMEGMATHHNDNDRETYSFFNQGSNSLNFSCESTEILNIQ